MAEGETDIHPETAGLPEDANPPDPSVPDGPFPKRPADPIFDPVEEGRVLVPLVIVGEYRFEIPPQPPVLVVDRRPGKIRFQGGGQDVSTAEIQDRQGAVESPYPCSDTPAGDDDAVTVLLPKERFDIPGAVRRDRRFSGFVLHRRGHLQLRLDDRWIQTTPTFDRTLCEERGYPLVEFDGRHDAVTETDRKACR